MAAVPRDVGREVDALSSTDGRVIRGDRTRQKLLDAALSQFSVRGFEATGMKELAAAAGIRTSSIYSHFPSKEAVLVAAIASGLQRFHAFVLDPDDPGLDDLARLEGLIRRHIAWQVRFASEAQSADDLLKLVRSGELLEEDSRKPIDTLLERYRKHINRLINRLRKPRALKLPPTPLCTEAAFILCDRALTWARAGRVNDPRLIEDYGWFLVSALLGLREQN